MSENDFSEACNAFLALEVLDVSECSLYLNRYSIETIGDACENLKAFGYRNGRLRGRANNSQAFYIAYSMYDMQKLKMVEVQLSDKGLLEILDQCPGLEIIYIQNCRHRMIGENLKSKLDKVQVKYYNYLINISSFSNLGMDDPDFRDWADLSWDVLREIFDRIDTVCLFVSVQSVCRQWRKLAQEPRLWRRLHLRGDLFPGCNLKNIGLSSFDRSAGCLEEFVVKDLYSTDVLLKVIAERKSKATGLKVLVLEGYCGRVIEDDLIEACYSFPALEVLDVSDCSLSLQSLHLLSIGNVSTRLDLKAFSFRNSRVRGRANNSQALFIADMHHLQKLKMVEDRLDDYGLHVILDQCPNLKIIYIRNCRHLLIGVSLQTKLEKVQLKYYNYLVNMFVDYDADYNIHGVSDDTYYSDYSNSDSDY
ncbi:hypothetical protein ZOSMA_87G01010 [Zostera marina]|uniref:F-box domain-containing protein n=1 Tax=Zostera marina TaxID=29655 RepID=A0A0K9NKP6_ZOSMR|nr:hypothetical protein ZOSMA_87G01010 [Zostera marina]